MENIISIQNLSVAFNGKQVLNNSTFKLKKGETIGIVGESGSGKSLTALAIMGLIPFPGEVNGSIVFNQQEILKTEDFEQIRGKQIGMIFQEPMTSLNPVLSCGEQVSETIIQHLKTNQKEAELKTLELFKKVKLPNPENIYNKFPHQLSGGQKQRVMIAIAISCNPLLLIADEPTTALDVTVQKTILELLKEIQQENNMSMIFISHDLAIVSEIAQNIMVMQNGNVLEKGATKEIFLNPQHPYTKALIACRPPINVRYKNLPTVKDFLNDQTKEFKAEIVNPEKRKQLQFELYQKEAIFKIQNLKIYYPAKTNFLGKTSAWLKAVDDVSFSIYQGETLGLIGESGCGKTTVGKSMVKLLTPHDGTIHYKNKNINQLNNSETLAYRKEVQIIFQDPYSSLNPRKTIGEAIVEVMKVHQLGENNDKRKNKTKQLLEKVGLQAEHFYRYPHEFSGGQRQRVSIARTLAVEPKVIVCDESVSALDISVQAQVLNLLNQLKYEFGLTYVFISHDLSVVKYMCDRMIVMNKNGKIEEIGESDVVYENPKSEYTKELIASIPKF